MNKLREIFAEYQSKTVEISQLEALIPRMNQEEREAIKGGDPNQPKTVNLLAGIRARRDLAVAKSQQLRAQQAEIEPELLREVQAEAVAFNRSLGACRDEVENNLVAAMKPFWNNDERAVRREIKGLGVPALERFRKLSSYNTLYDPRNGTLLQHVLMFLGQVDRAVKELAWK